MHPVRFSPAAGVLPRFDQASADHAGLAWSVGEVIFLGGLFGLAEVGIRESPALARDIALLWCVSGGHHNDHDTGLTESRL